MEILPNGIPLIDFFAVTNNGPDSAFAETAKNVARAMEMVGCFYVKNHGIDQALLSNTFDNLRSFFVLPVEQKMKFTTADRKRGYMPFESINFNAFLGRSGFPEDPIERLVFGPENSKEPNAKNIWPDIPPSLKRNGQELQMNLQELANTVAKVLGFTEEADAAEVHRVCNRDPNMMKVNFYPGIPPKAMQNDRLAEHVDASAFTIVANDGNVSGLQVKGQDGDWVWVDPVADTLFINLGCVMEEVVRGKWKACQHKVGWPNDGVAKDRLSLVYFVSQFRFVDETSRVSDY